MMFIPGLGGGSKRRLERVKELKSYTDIEALEFCISIGWLAAEKQAKERKLRTIVKADLKDDSESQEKS